MSMMPGPAEIQRQLSNVSDFSQFLELQLQNASILNLIESITYNTHSQTVIIKLGNLLIQETDRMEESRFTSVPETELKLKRLSEHYRAKYPEFLNYFNQWKPFREKLIRTSNASANKIDRNFYLSSTARIITSAADIFGTLQLFRPQMSSWGMFTIENASFIGMVSIFLEMSLSKQYHSEAKKIIKEDQEKFEGLKKWFKQDEELDNAVKDVFPYGIDKDLVRRIDEAYLGTDKDNKLFMSIVASNVKNDVNLFKDKDFLFTAKKVSTSETGRQWFNKVILEDDPLLNECIKFNISSEILTASFQNPDIILGTSTLLTTKAKYKILLNGLTIFSAVSNLWSDMKSENSDALRELARKAENELHAIKKVLILLKPSGINIGSALQ